MNAVDSAPPDERAARLRTMWRVATGLLLLMAACFLACRLGLKRWPWLEWPGAFAEAALIGGLADWFAVVALFRHPFGLPIPHTSILTRRQAQIASSLAQFVVDNFLGGALLRERLGRVNVAGILFDWGRAEARPLSKLVAGWAPQFLDSLDHGEVGRFLHAQVERWIASVPLAPVAGKLLEVLTAGGRHEVLLDEILGMVERLLLENRPQIERAIRDEIPLPEHLLLLLSLEELKNSIAGWVAGKLVTRVQDLLAASSKDRNHPVRRQFTERVVRLVEELKTSPEYLARGEQIKHELLANSGLREYASSLWGGIRAQLLAQLGHEGCGLQPGLERAVLGAIEALEKDGALAGKTNAWILGAVLQMVETHRESVFRFLEQTVLSWDGARMSAKLELEVGADLQFVRINGALVGGLVGTLIHAAIRLLG